MVVQVVERPDSKELPYNPDLRMVWAEITRSCNEQCGHCYNDSGAHRASEETLGKETWFRVFAEAREQGARHLQFIGGEPTLVPWLSEGIAEARRLGFEIVEIYTNATRLSEQLFQSIVSNRVSVAVSLYSHIAEEHDRITMLPGSYERTIAAIRRLQEAGVELRVAVVRVPLNRETCQATIEFVQGMGIANVGIDNARAFGRAQALLGRTPELNELCGHCWKGTICIDPQGNVSPCIMSRHMRMGNVESSSVGEILSSQAALAARRTVYEEVYLPRQSAETNCLPNEPNPTPDCLPYSCGPTPCQPQICMPGNDRCFPLKDYVSADVCPPGAEGSRMVELIGGVQAAAGAVGELVGVGESACLPNEPNPTPNCMPYSCTPTPCSPHTCNPGTQRCYPLGG